MTHFDLHFWNNFVSTSSADPTSTKPPWSLRRGLNNILNQAPNFEGLVLFCIEAKICIQILIFQYFSRSRRFAILCTAQISKFQQKSRHNFGKMNKFIFQFISFFAILTSKLSFFCKVLMKIFRNFTDLC